MGKSAAGLILIAWLLFMSNAARLCPQNDPPRTVNIKIAVDSTLGNLTQWRAAASSYLYECIAIFKDQFGIKLDIRELCYWYPPRGTGSLQEAMSDFKSTVQPGPWDAVLGIIAPECITQSGCGISSYIYGYILLQNLKSKLEIKHALLHELCHIFGAIDLREKGSIMSTVDFGFRLDTFTRQTILLHKSRRFDRSSFPLPQENLDRAVALFKERVDLCLNEPEVGFYLAQMYLEKGDCEAGLRTCNELGKANSHLVGIHNVLGNAYFACGRIDQAIAEYQQAIELQPKEPGIHYNLGQAYFRKGLDEAAETEYRKALQLNPGYAPAHLNLGQLYLLKGKSDAAIIECRSALKIEPEYAEALFMLGSAILLQSERLFKRNLAGSAGVWDPDLDDVAEARRVENAIQEAIDLCQKAVTINPSIPEAHNALGAALAYQGRPSEAESEFLKALEIKPDYQEAHYNLALMYYKNGQMNRAFHQIKLIPEVNPTTNLEIQILARVFQAENSYAVFADNIKK